MNARAFAQRPANSVTSSQETSYAPRARIVSAGRRQYADNEKSGLESTQTKIAIGRPGDGYEREADRVSERVLSTPADTWQGGTELRMKRQNDGHAPNSDVPPALQQLRGSVGRPLDTATREQMESKFHFDFGRVRVHSGEPAHRAAMGLSARAFTLGSEIVFARHQYAPNNGEGRRLLAHELAHVVQQTGDSSLVLRRAPILQGKSQNEFGDRDAPTVDKAIAASPITKWVPAKNLIKLTGNVDVEDPVVFEKQFKNFGQSNENVDEVPGFVDRTQKKPVKLRLPGKNAAGQLVTAARFEAAVHETVHLNSNATFRNNFGHSYNEGVTQYFTELVLGESGNAYRDRIKLAEGLLAVVSQDELGKAYFQGERALYAKVVKALGQSGQTGFSDWVRAKEKEPPDWRTANALLKSAFAGSKQPAATATPAKTAPSQPEKPSE